MWQETPLPVLQPLFILWKNLFLLFRNALLQIISLEDWILCLLIQSIFQRNWNFFACFYIFFLSLPSRGRLLCVSNFFSTCWADYSCILWGILFQHSEIVFLNLCIVNKICPNQVSLSLFKIYMWEIYKNIYMCVCLQSIKEVWWLNWFRKHSFCTVGGVIIFCDYLSVWSKESPFSQLKNCPYPWNMHSDEKRWVFWAG